MGQLAQQKSTNADVKSFGQMLIADHGQHRNQVSTLAQTMKVTLPAKLTHKGQAEYDALSKLSGAAFDKAFGNKYLNSEALEKEFKPYAAKDYVDVPR